MAEQRTDVLDEAGVAIDVAVIVDASKLDRSTKKESSSKEKTAEEIAAELRNPVTPMAAIKTKWVAGRP